MIDKRIGCISWFIYVSSTNDRIDIVSRRVWPLASNTPPKILQRSSLRRHRYLSLEAAGAHCCLLADSRSAGFLVLTVARALAAPSPRSSLPFLRCASWTACFSRALWNRRVLSEGGWLFYEQVAIVID